MHLLEPDSENHYKKLCKTGISAARLLFLHDIIFCMLNKISHKIDALFVDRDLFYFSVHFLSSIIMLILFFFHLYGTLKTIVTKLRQASPLIFDQQKQPTIISSFSRNESDLGTILA